MKSSEKRLREWIGDHPVMSHRYDCERQVVGSTRYPDGRHVYCSCGLDEILGHPTDLERLVEWLEKWEKRGRESKGYQATMAADAITDVITYMGAEFGVGGKDD